MLLKFNTQKENCSGTHIWNKFGNLDFSIELEEVEYVHENEAYIFFIDTNISKSRENHLLRCLDRIDDLKHKPLSKFLHGNYFVVALDKATKNIHILRDPSGVKTGYFTLEDGSLYIGSVMHDVAKLRNKIEFDGEAVYQILYSNYLIDGFTFYKDVKEIQMGMHLVFDNHLIEISCQKKFVPLHRRDNEWGEEENFKRLRTESQKAHKGYINEKNRVLLSGGLDSIAMLISLDDLVENDKLDSLSFRVKDTVEDETIYARSISQHLGISNRVIEVDPCNEKNFEDFESKLMQMNNPYFGIWIFGNLENANPYEMYYAGQDTRLHTPALNEVDKWAFSLIKHQNAFWLKNVAMPLSKLANKTLKALKWDKSKSRILRNLYKATYLFNLKSYLDKFYLKLDSAKIEEKGLSLEHFEAFKKHFEYDLKNIPNERALYNKLVELKWKEQYIFDMRYLQDMARMNNTYVAMPFYDAKLATFSSSIPFKMATKAMIGRARFGSQKNIIYKYVLRYAFKDKMNDTSFYRAKAVSSTLHQLFNGPMGIDIKKRIEEDLNRAENSFIRQFQLEAFVAKFLWKKQWEIEEMGYLGTIYYIGAMIIYHENVVLAAQQKSLENKSTVKAQAA